LGEREVGGIMGGRLSFIWPFFLKRRGGIILFVSENKRINAHLAVKKNMAKLRNKAARVWE
jgi:hypothetical protein